MPPLFTPAGRPPPPWTHAPRLVLPEATAAALCQQHAPLLLGDLALTWRCDESGLH